MGKTREHLILWDNHYGVEVTAHPSAAAAEKHFRMQEEIPDDVTLEQYFEMRQEAEDNPCGAPDWMDVRGNYSTILGQIDVAEGDGPSEMERLMMAQELIGSLGFSKLAELAKVCLLAMNKEIVSLQELDSVTAEDPELNEGSPNT